MKPGEQRKIALTKLGEINLDLMIEVCKDFIDNGNYDYEFSNDFRFIKRLLNKF